MRTTVHLPDHLLLQAKQLAVARRSTLTAIVAEGLRMFLAEAARVAADERSGVVIFPVSEEAQPQPGVDLCDSSELWALDG